MSIFSQPGLWVGAGVVLAVVLLSGILTRAPWWRITLAAAGALAFVVGAQWAWNLGIEAFVAAGLAALGIAIWDESAVRLLEARRATRVAVGPGEEIAVAAPEPAVRPRRSTAPRTVVTAARRSPAPTTSVRAKRASGARAEPDVKPVPRTASATRTKPIAPTTPVARAKPAARTTRAAVGPGPAPAAGRATRRGVRGSTQR